MSPYCMLLLKPAFLHHYTEHTYNYWLTSDFSFSFFFFFLIFGCVRSLLQREEATPCCSAQASHCGGFSCCEAWALGAQASVVAACGLSSCSTQALERAGFSSRGAQAQ